MELAAVDGHQQERKVNAYKYLAIKPRLKSIHRL